MMILLIELNYLIKFHQLKAWFLFGLILNTKKYFFL